MVYIIFKDFQILKCLNILKVIKKNMSLNKQISGLYNALSYGLYSATSQNRLWDVVSADSFNVVTLESTNSLLMSSLRLHSVSEKCAINYRKCFSIAHYRRPIRFFALEILIILDVL